MKGCTRFIWRDETILKEQVRTIRVRIFEKSKNSNLYISSPNFIEHDGEENANANLISNFSYVITSTGIKKMWNTVTFTKSVYVYICLFITSDFDSSVLDKLDWPEMKYVKEAFNTYSHNKELKTDSEFQDLMLYMQDIMPNDWSNNYNKLLEAIRAANIHQIESLIEKFSWKYKSLVWEKTAKIIVTKKMEIS